EAKMKITGKMTRLPPHAALILLVTVIATVTGCGVSSRIACTAHEVSVKYRTYGTQFVQPKKT
ncbi:hypothetical protein KIN20_020549, partial [Parelaphostrongylus tenuis]